MNDACPPRTRPGFRRGRYLNPPGAPRPDCGPGGLAGFLWRRALDRTVPQSPPGHVRPPERVLPDWNAEADTDQLLWLGHAAFLLRLAGRTLLTDPFLGDVAAPAPLRAPRRFVPPALRVTELPPLDGLLVSHSHYDHLDAPTIDALPDKADLPVVVPAGLDGFFRRRGYRNVQALSWWETAELAGLQVTAVPAIHFSRRGALDRNRALWCGFVIDDGRRRVYFVGDTAYAPVFREVGEAFGGIDTVLVPIGAYEPRGVMAGAHVNPEEAARLCVDARARRAVAMHWGTIVLTDEPAFAPPGRWRQAMAAEGYDDNAVWVPAIGETRPL